MVIPGGKWILVLQKTFVFLLLFSYSVVSDSLRPCGLWHARLSCVLHYLPEFAQTRVSDATQPSHPLLSPSPPTLNLSQHQGPFQ